MPVITTWFKEKSSQLSFSILTTLSASPTSSELLPIDTGISTQLSGSDVSLKPITTDSKSSEVV